MTQRIRRFLPFVWLLFALSLLGCASQVRVDAPSQVTQMTLQSLHARNPKALATRVCVLPDKAPPGTRFIAADDIMKTIVSDRNRGAMLLAYSLRKEVLPQLRAALETLAGAPGVDDLAAAIDAIENENHNYFVDRTHSGKVTLAIE